MYGLHQARRRGALWLSAALVVILAAVVAWMVAPLSPGVVVLQFAWSPRAFGEIVHVWPPEDLARYRAHLPVDFALLFAYGVFGYLLATRTGLFTPLPPRLRRLAPSVLALAALFDAAENVLHAWLTEMPRFDVPQVYLASTACSGLKWTLLLAFGVLVVWALAVADDQGEVE